MDATIHVLRPDGKSGGEMPVSKYEAIRHFILQRLHENEALNITELLEQAGEFFILHNLPWDILQVKLDLQAKGMIKSFTNPNSRRVTYLKLTREGVKLISRLQKENTECL